MTDENLTPQEKDALKEYLGFGAQIPEEKYNVHSFLHKVATSDDTTKTGNLTIEELGMPKLNLRAIKGISLMAEMIVGNDLIASYFTREGEIMTSSSLSKDAKLLTLAVIQKRIIEDATKPRKENSGWFKPKEKKMEGEL
jgi:hypothetical protein